MRKFGIYSKNEGGMITYKGEQEWDSVEDLIESTFGWTAVADELDAETEQMIGWPHSEVTWYGNLGVATA